MTEDKIRDLLQEADRSADQHTSTRVDISAIRRQAGRRRLASLVGPVAAAAVLMIALGVWSLRTKAPAPTDDQRKIVALQDQVKELQASTHAALALIHEVLEDERRRDRLEELEAKLASMPDPLDKIQEQVDKTAFMLVYQADRLYRELNETESAVETYNRVIELFPKNQWATVARQRLSEIEGRRI